VKFPGAEKVENHVEGAWMPTMIEKYTAEIFYNFLINKDHDVWKRKTDGVWRPTRKQMSSLETKNYKKT
jgi:hypothetical protein